MAKKKSTKASKIAAARCRYSGALSLEYCKHLSCSFSFLLLSRGLKERKKKMQKTSRQYPTARTIKLIQYVIKREREKDLFWYFAVDFLFVAHSILRDWFTARSEPFRCRDAKLRPFSFMRQHPHSHWTASKQGDRCVIFLWTDYCISICFRSWEIRIQLLFICCSCFILLNI